MIGCNGAESLDRQTAATTRKEKMNPSEIKVCLGAVNQNPPFPSGTMTKDNTGI
jgi:hypothetical protein